MKSYTHDLFRALEIMAIAMAVIEMDRASYIEAVIFIVISVIFGVVKETCTTTTPK